MCVARLKLRWDLCIHFVLILGVLITTPGCGQVLLGDSRDSALVATPTGIKEVEIRMQRYGRPGTIQDTKIFSVIRNRASDSNFEYSGTSCPKRDGATVSEDAWPSSQVSQLANDLAVVISNTRHSLRGFLWTPLRIVGIGCNEVFIAVPDPEIYKSSNGVIPGCSGLSAYFARQCPSTSAGVVIRLTFATSESGELPVKSVYRARCQSDGHFEIEEYRVYSPSIGVSRVIDDIYAEMIQSAQINKH